MSQILVRLHRETAAFLFESIVLRFHLEISPQYHSASVSKLPVSVIADGAIFDLAGLAGRTENKGTGKQILKNYRKLMKKYLQI